MWISVFEWLCMVTVRKFVSATNDVFDETRVCYVYMSKAMIKIAILQWQWNHCLYINYAMRINYSDDADCTCA